MIYCYAQFFERFRVSFLKSTEMQKIITFSCKNILDVLFKE